MQVKKLGERGIISMIHRMQSSPPPGFVGIGDDAAVLPGNEAGWLVSQDMLVEEIHFRWDWATPDQVGGKAAQVNLSDIAAMGGRPVAAPAPRLRPLAARQRLLGVRRPRRALDPLHR